MRPNAPFVKSVGHFALSWRRKRTWTKLNRKEKEKLHELLLCSTRLLHLHNIVQDAMLCHTKPDDPRGFGKRSPTTPHSDMCACASAHMHAHACMHFILPNVLHAGSQCNKRRMCWVSVHMLDAALQSMSVEMKGGVVAQSFKQQFPLVFNQPGMSID